MPSLAHIDHSEPARLAHPRWLLRRIRSAWPDAAEQILAANNEQPPLTLRVNLARTTREAQLALLAAQDIAAQPGLCATTIVLDQPVDVNALPGFADGLVSVQDAGAQLAAELLDARTGERVLDACAAPGGKTCHILERTPDLGELVALDVDAARLDRVQQNLTRLGLTATLQVADLLAPGSWDGRPFDRILLDAPCSGTGVIRRHPDIKLLRREADIAGFAATQLDMLTRCAGMLKAGGLMVYATCSILLAENTEVVGALSAAAARIHPCGRRPACAASATRQRRCRDRRVLLCSPEKRGRRHMRFLPGVMALLLPLLAPAVAHASGAFDVQSAFLDVARRHVRTQRPRRLSTQ